MIRWCIVPESIYSCNIVSVEIRGLGWGLRILRCILVHLFDVVLG